MYQEETYESNEDEAREAAQLADDQARFDYEAALQQQTLWQGAAFNYFSLATDLARELAAAIEKEAA